MAYWGSQGLSETKDPPPGFPSGGVQQQRPNPASAAPLSFSHFNENPNGYSVETKADVTNWKHVRKSGPWPLRIYCAIAAAVIFFSVVTIGIGIMVVGDSSDESSSALAQGTSNSNATSNPISAPTPEPSPAPTPDPTPQPNPSSCPGSGTIQLNPSQSPITLPVSGVGKLCTLSYGNSEQEMITAARSYENENWEEVAPETGISISCSSGSCDIQLHQVVSPLYLTGYSSSISTDESWSRFLTQVSFGPTLLEINNQTGHKDYILEQMALPATSHRRYYRERVNPRTSAASKTGRPREACEQNSRWNQYSFMKEDEYKQITASNSSDPNRYSISVDGIVRTEIPKADWPLSISTEYTICNVKEGISAEIKFGIKPACSNTFLLNPIIFFFDPPPGAVSQVAKLEDITPTKAGVKLLEEVPPLCGLSDLAYSGPIYVQSLSGDYYMHDPRLVLLDNDLSNPYSSFVSNGVECPKTPMTFLNIDSCVTKPDACIKTTFGSTRFVLDGDEIIKWFELSNKRVHAIDALPISEILRPCEKGKVSRWVSEDGECDVSSNIDDHTRQTLENLLLQSISDNNTKVSDIFMPVNAQCTDSTSRGISLEVAHVDGLRCWTHVHPDTRNVYDFTDWAIQHPGNSVKADAITKWADNGTAIITYPHDITAWNENKYRFTYLGRMGDEVDFAQLDESVQTIEMANHLGVTITQESIARACGSPGEVESNPKLGSRFGMQQNDKTDLNQKMGRFDQNIFSEQIKETVWFMISIFSEDQLRQRMAWALSQIFVVTAVQTDKFRNTENFVNFYDILVRNAFGNFKDILRETSFSPMMSQMLTYTGSKSYAWSLENNNREEFPDENYAREIMQLFTIGLYKLNDDGTTIRDQNNKPLETYTNEDIMTFARAWTGFQRQEKRGNYENDEGVDTENKIDPLRIIPEHRDVFPKMDLNKGYIGDGYPRCIDFPDSDFLVIGAEYRFLGENGSPETQTEGEPRGNPGTRLTLDPQNSFLYEALCQADANGNCNYKSKVILQANLTCQGVECSVDTVTTVEVNGFFYEYVRRPCIQFPFFENSKKIILGDTTQAMCANTRLEVASQACCSTGSTTATQTCQYHGERVKFWASNVNCPTGKSTCDFSSIVANCDENPEPYYWTNGQCNILVKVKYDGKVAVVHQPTQGTSSVDTITFMRDYVSKESKNFFRVNWDGTFPTKDNNCASAQKCTLEQIDGEDYCICETTVDDEKVFSQIKSRDEILSKLYMTSPPKEIFGNDYYLLESSASADVKVYSRRSQFPNTYTRETIFKVRDRQNRVKYFKNMKSEVSISDTSMKFRNPPTFLSFVKASERDAFFETEAVLDHYFTHESTAPFIATRLIQRFVSSNPSKSYVKNVATAFKDGSFQGIGTGEYGDLAATVAAILLDKEARSEILDEDPTAGQLREPILKLIHFMRAMEVNTDGLEVEFQKMIERIGQQVYLAPSVFSFFLPEFAAPGRIKSALLVSPEAQVLTTPLIINYLNGMFSLARFGLIDCDDGFGDYGNGRNCNNMRDGIDDPDQYAHARLEFAPSLENGITVVDELDLLLTNGRLSDTSRNLLIDVYNNERDEKDAKTALKVIQQLFALTPEFQSTNMNRPLGIMRQDTPAISRTKPYKAIVYLFLRGAADSFNMLVPHSNCDSGTTSYEQYASVRGPSIAHAKTELLEIFTTGQVCDSFGLHPKMTFLKDLYTQNDCIFTANVGTLLEPVTKAQYQDGGIVNLPPNLFAHNHQERATQSLDPEDPASTGVLGRITDELSEQGFSTRSFSLTKQSEVAITGEAGKSPPMDILSPDAIDSFNTYPLSQRTLSAAFDLTEKSQSIFGDVWGEAFQRAVNRSEELVTDVGRSSLTQTFPSTSIGEQLEMAAKLIQTSTADRDVFFISVDGWDTHNSAKDKLNDKLEEINAALEPFVNEMKAQLQWDNVLLLTASDFGRKLKSNGVGTDHGWGGNYWLMGGDLNGGKVLGTFPDSLADDGSVIIENGRVIPTTPWEAIWNSVAVWFGVSDIDAVLPHRGNFPSGQLFDQNDIFN